MRLAEFSVGFALPGSLQPPDPARPTRTRAQCLRWVGDTFLFLPQLDVFDAAERYQQAGLPLIILAGKEYGSGSSRDWAAKGPFLLVSMTWGRPSRQLPSGPAGKPGRGQESTPVLCFPRCRGRAAQKSMQCSLPSCFVTRLRFSLQGN